MDYSKQFDQLSEREKGFLFGYVTTILFPARFNEVFQLLPPKDREQIETQIEKMISPHPSGLPYETRLSRYLTEKMILERSSADCAASEIAEQIAALEQKWMV